MINPKVYTISFFKSLWDGCMPIVVDMPDDECFDLWMQGHSPEDIDRMIRKAGRKFSRHVLYGVPMRDSEAAPRYVSASLGHLSTQRLARELREQRVR